ncbi:PREDICTED: peptidyl-prolyl cis-trans isomerase-like 4 [Rhagoletis zephyria]|uniref:peptidyl-prolyl cis-trans isomerase-like 4 n=1 Tax=Rhagoletis zephyria TaxID=28612 RepID=UPI00081151C4|nr:PREDICTED: peptidyl-prolyl cis-trans isomerase-like 4 [Rhagoletis zephyria]
MSVVIETTIGDITVDLFVDERPIACLNFIKLCKIKYYNFNLFHTIERGFIAQTGDPTGAGNGGSSIWGQLDGTEKRFFETETMPKIYHESAGLLSLVSAGKNLVGSQFFFTLAPNLSSLDGTHCVIGEVVEGHEILRKLNETIVDENFRPYQDIRITHTVILEDPYPDPRNLKLPSRSPSPNPQRFQNGRIAADEDIDDTDGKTAEELQEMLSEREAKARATILEIVGDLPDAEMAPPENVLFVCKLNPVTTDDDLEIIFSRFGKVKSCEVIRDRKTGDSLQYAFVEFEDQKSCEAAYFKMDNVLIDDRRIHVDFSQSVAKVKWRGKGRGVEGSLKNRDFDNLREPSWKQERDNRKRNGDDRDNTKRMSSTERRLAREERHREQHDRERKEKHKYERDHHSSYHSQHRRQERRVDGNTARQRRRSREHYRQSRSRSGERARKYSPDSQRRDKHSKSTDRRRNNPEETKQRHYVHHISSEKQVDKKRLPVRSDDRSKKPKSKSKCSKRVSTSTSDDTDSSSSESETESSSTDTSTTSSDGSSDASNKRRRHGRKHKVSKKKSSKRKSHKRRNRHKK